MCVNFPSTENKKRIIRKGLILADMACYCMNSCKTGKSGGKLFFQIIHDYGTKAASRLILQENFR